MWCIFYLQFTNTANVKINTDELSYMDLYLVLVLALALALY